MFFTKITINLDAKFQIKKEQNLNRWHELESDLWDTVDSGRKWLVDFNAGKTQLVSFDWSNNTGAIDVKMNGSVLEEK